MAKEKPLTREDVLRLIKENGGTAEGLDLSGKVFEGGIDLRELDLAGIILNGACFNLGGEELSGLKSWKTLGRGAQLQGTYLSFAQLQYVELGAASLRGAILVGAQLRGTNLLLADLTQANLQDAQLQDTNLSDAFLQGTNFNRTKLEGAHLYKAKFSNETRLEDADWGNYILGEEKTGMFDWAADAYRRLKMWYTQAGYSGIAAKFYYREKEANRKALKLYSRHRLALEFLRALFGYGEGWKRVLASIAVLILLFALTYCAIGSVWEWSAFGNSLYFSAVSFTALGYGSWVQVTNNWIKGIGAFESLVGVSMMALLLVTFFRKWTR